MKKRTLTRKDYERFENDRITVLTDLKKSVKREDSKRQIDVYINDLEMSEGVNVDMDSDVEVFQYLSKLHDGPTVMEKVRWFLGDWGTKIKNAYLKNSTHITLKIIVLVLVIICTYCWKFGLFKLLGTTIHGLFMLAILGLILGLLFLGKYKDIFISLTFILFPIIFFSQIKIPSANTVGYIVRGGEVKDVINPGAKSYKINRERGTMFFDAPNFFKDKIYWSRLKSESFQFATNNKQQINESSDFTIEYTKGLPELEIGDEFTIEMTEIDEEVQEIVKKVVSEWDSESGIQTLKDNIDSAIKEASLVYPITVNKISINYSF